jgi:hypothetical protein
MLFAAEAYNAEMGISNEMFQSERDETAECQFATTPNDITNTDGMTHAELMGGVEKFAFYMRFLGQPIPSIDTPGGATSIAEAKAYSSVSAARSATRRHFTPATRQLRGFVQNPSISIPICYSTTWAPDWKMAAARDKQAREIFALRRSGA